MLKKKFKAAVWSAALLWVIVFIQIITTRLYVSKTDISQAFARNQLTVERENTDTRNLKEGNVCLEGHISGKLSENGMERLAASLFRTMGGGCVMEHKDDSSTGYYVAYGYTNGISSFKKVNGRRINMNVAMQYDESQNRTNVIMGTPLINSDY